MVLAAIEDSHCALRACTGSVEMSVFQTLSCGKTWQLVPGTGAAPAGTALATIEASDDETTTAIPSSTLRITMSKTLRVWPGNHQRVTAR